MSLYRIYIDETGNHDMTHVDDLNQRFLALTGVIVKSEYISSTLQPEMDALKHAFFQVDPDEPVIFHRKDIINRRPPFDVLRDPTIENEFNTNILEALNRWDYKVITVTIDKKSHRDQYSVWRYHPYHYCLSVILERFVLFLIYCNSFGDVMVESRGVKEDEKLKQTYRYLYQNGTDPIPPQRWRGRLTSKELKVKPKSSNIPGLQLADLVAHPSSREILLDHQLIKDDRDIFGDKITSILRQSKYLRSRSGQILGYGKKLLPK